MRKLSIGDRLLNNSSTHAIGMNSGTRNEKQRACLADELRIIVEYSPTNVNQILRMNRWAASERQELRQARRRVAGLCRRLGRRERPRLRLGRFQGPK